MNEFLRSQIYKSQDICSQQTEKYNKKVGILKNYQVTYLQYIENEKQRVDGQIFNQQMEDRIRQQKVLLQESLREFKQKLKGTELQKFDLLKKCERNQGKFQKLRSVNDKLRNDQKLILDQKSSLKRKIAENETVNIKICVQNQLLRKRCQQQLQQVGEKGFSSKNSNLLEVIKGKLGENISNLQEMENKGKQLFEYYKTQKETSKIENKKKILELQVDLRKQVNANQAIKQQIQGQKHIETVFTMKKTIIQKIREFKQAILNSQEENQLKNQTMGLSKQNSILKQKLSKFLQVQKEMEKVYENLSANLQSYKYQDMKSLNKMNVHSSRFEKGLDYRRQHFLRERQNIVERYGKYLE